MTDNSNQSAAFEHFTCATNHLAAERALRIIEQATRLGEVMTGDDMLHLKSLCDEAGVAFARRALNQPDGPF